MHVLSLDVQQAANEIAIPLACLQGIWTKASELLTSTENIVSAPGCDPAARLVTSPTAHLVVPTKAGYKCDSDCANFKALGICSHTVVVAHLNDHAAITVCQISQGKKKPNMTNLALHGMPTGTRKKGSRPPRKRAKHQVYFLPLSPTFLQTRSQQVHILHKYFHAHTIHRLHLVSHTHHHTLHLFVLVQSVGPVKNLPLPWCL